MSSPAEPTPAASSASDDAPHVFERVGGQPFFDELVDRFYDDVARDDVLRPLYPADLAPSRRHLALFLGQYWGGPTTYSDERGHPALRARHLPFAIGAAERDAWLTHMRSALRATAAERDVDDEIITAIDEYFSRAADWLVNQRDSGRRSLL